MPKLLDIFCKVIDNYGDIGVCWRLSADLASRGQRVRLWTDDASALQWMAPDGCPGVEIRAWSEPLNLLDTAAADVVIEAFGCNIDHKYIANYLCRTSEKCLFSPWVNLEYLSAEAFAAKNHGLPSPVLAGLGAGAVKHFFYPGFTAGTGGLLREPDLVLRQARFDRAAWLLEFGITLDTARGERLMSLFCYEPPALDALLQQLERDPTPTRLLVAHGRPAAAVRASLARLAQLARLAPLEGKIRHFPTWNIDSLLSILYLPVLTQLQFDELLWACDINFVRGEDSLVRAIWAGKPFVWQIYPQDDGAHHAKLTAFLHMMAAPASLRRFTLQWNSVALAGDVVSDGGSDGGNDAGIDGKIDGRIDGILAPPASSGAHPLGLQPADLEAFDLPAWNASVDALRTRLFAQIDLTTQLIAFVDRLK